MGGEANGGIGGSTAYTPPHAGLKGKESHSGNIQVGDPILRDGKVVDEIWRTWDEGPCTVEEERKMCRMCGFVEGGKQAGLLLTSRGSG
jgi:hypothetical protein